MLEKGYLPSRAKTVKEPEFSIEDLMSAMPSTQYSTTANICESWEGEEEQFIAHVNGGGTRRMASAADPTEGTKAVLNKQFQRSRN
jgi:hypothetical protein